MTAHKNPTPTVDGVLQRGSKILMVRRKKEPFQGRLALPGGFVNEGETVEDAFRREVLEETSLEVEPIDILGVYSDPERDPRKHTMSVVFVGLILGGAEKAGDDAGSLEWIDIAGLDRIKDELVFDHAQILADYVRWKGSMGTYWSTKRRGS
ncbi:MAG: NUDIX hydrolase [Nitrososphaera sp.]|jgi:ADP-ribose pyrophosphatase YjhB (NUDIX family)